MKRVHNRALVPRKTAFAAGAIFLLIIHVCKQPSKPEVGADRIPTNVQMGAIAIGLDGELGSIQPGMLADLIVIDGDPLEDIRESENLLCTIVNGRRYDARNLDQLGPNRLPLPSSPNLDGKLGIDARSSCAGEKRQDSQHAMK